MPSSLANGWRPPSERSMIASRACPSATPGASKNALAVRPTVTQLGQHRVHDVCLRGPPKGDDAADPAHQRPQAA